MAAVLMVGCNSGAELVVERAPVAVSDVWAAGPDEAWGVGYTEGGSYTGPISTGPNIVRYDGETWTTAWESPGVSLSGVWGASASDVWAVGSSLGVAIIAHYDGSAWSLAETGLPFPDSGTEYLEDVAGTGPSDVWAVGGSDGSGDFAALVMHYDGTAWTVEPAPPAADLVAVHVTGDGTVWALSRRDGVFRRDGAAWTHFDSGLAIPDGAHLSRIGEADGRIWIGGAPGIAFFEDGAFVARESAEPGEVRGNDAIVRGDLQVFTTFDHGSSSCTFSGCTSGTSTEIATIHNRRAGGERTLEIESIQGEPSEFRTVSLSGVRFFATDAELWVLGPSYWRIPTPID
jgi:hypothetical protein